MNDQLLMQIAEVASQWLAAARDVPGTPTWITYRKMDEIQILLTEWEARKRTSGTQALPTGRSQLAPASREEMVNDN